MTIEIICDNCDTELLVERENFLTGDVQRDLALLLSHHSIEAVIAALKKWVAHNLTSDATKGLKNECTELI